MAHREPHVHTRKIMASKAGWGQLSVDLLDAVAAFVAPADRMRCLVTFVFNFFARACGGKP